MKLPDFNNHPGIKSLHQKMGITPQESEPMKNETLTISLSHREADAVEALIDFAQDHHDKGTGLHAASMIQAQAVVTKITNAASLEADAFDGAKEALHALLESLDPSTTRGGRACTVVGAMIDALDGYQRSEYPYLRG